jgi:leader peptidase (prepilin peptidase) / N-methyltransferase
MVDLAAAEGSFYGEFVVGGRLRGAYRTVVVLVAAGLAAAVFVRFGFTERGAIEAFVAAILVWLSSIDLERRVLPNRIVLPAAAIVLAAQCAAFPGQAVEWVVSAAAAAGFLLLPLLAYPSGMGMGDVKLALLLGAALGRLVALALILGLIAAALVGLALIARRGLAARKQAIPLGPFLALGTILALFLGTPGHSP